MDLEILKKKISTFRTEGVVTKPGMGISHFSLVYAAPVGPTFRSIGEQDQPGADTFGGALSTSIKLPSFKSLGQEISPALVYKSSWAKPTTVISNLFDIPRSEITINDVQSGGVWVSTRIASKKCVGFSCSDADADFWFDLYYRQQTQATAWYVPRQITAQFLTTGITSQEIPFTGMPSRATISYAMDLKSSNGAYLDSGIYPYLAKYNVYLDQMIVGTRTTTTWTDFSAPQVKQDHFQETREIEKAFPSDLSGNLFVQNKINSPAGRGWKIAGVQKIVNPNSNRIMLEEADGDISTYSLSNTINTLFDAAAASGDLSFGVDLSIWPNLYVSSQGATKFFQLDLSSANPSPMPVGDNLNLSGAISGYSVTDASARFGFYPRVLDECQRSIYSYQSVSTPKQLLALPDGRLIGTDSTRSLVFGTQAGNTRVYAGSVANARYFGDSQGGTGFAPPASSSYKTDISNYCSALNLTCNVTIADDWFNYISWYGCSSTTYIWGGTRLNVPVYFPSTDYWHQLPIPNPGSSYGWVPNPGFNGDGNSASVQFNQPMGITAGPKPNTIVVADYGNHRVRMVDLVANTVTTVAGNGSWEDAGDGFDLTPKNRSSCLVSLPVSKTTEGDGQYEAEATFGRADHRDLEAA